MSHQLLCSPVPVAVVVDETDAAGNVECGFRALCFEGNVDGIEVECTTGGGCGSPWVTLTVGGRYFRIDLREVAKVLAAHVQGGGCPMTAERDTLASRIAEVVPQCTPEGARFDDDGSGSVLVRGSVTQAQIQAVADIVQQPITVHGMGGTWLMLEWFGQSPAEVGL